MKYAYVLINCELGKEEEVHKKLVELNQVKEAHIVYGVHDIVVLIEAETTQELKDTINMSIRRLENIRSTITMMVM